MPEVTGKPAWDEERKVLRIPVRMGPGTTYHLRLNTASDQNFPGAEGEALALRIWAFTVR